MMALLLLSHYQFGGDESERKGSLGFFLVDLFSGGRPEGSKPNLKFQSAMWHHFKHSQSKDVFSCCLSFTTLELFFHNYVENL
jgi:hypothetical protein